MILKSYRTALLLSLFFVTTIGTSASAFADIYSVGYIDNPGIKNIVSIDDYGNYTVLTGSPVAPSEATYHADGSDANNPAGSDPCAITAKGFYGTLLCNNGHVLLEGEYEGPDGEDIFGLWSGSDPDPVLDLVSRGYFQGGIMSDNGNALLIDPQNDTFYVAIDEGPSPSQVPEPSTVILLGTGALAVFGTIRRKRMSIV